MNENKVILCMKNLTHIYSVDTPFEKAAIKNITLDIIENDFIGIIGHTGSGKSTLIQHLNALLKPTSGNIFFDGEDIWKKGYNRRGLRFNVGMVFQYPEHQLFEETVEKDIGFGPKNMGLGPEEIKERVIFALHFTGLDEKILSKSPFELSGGQKRRVAIAGIIAMKPRILILDEPTAGLDPRGRDEILAKIKEYHRNEKVAVILVSHSMDEVANNAEKILVMNNGSIEMIDSVKNVFNNSSILKNIGLNVPQITGIFFELKKSGYDVDTSIFSIKDAAKEIERLYYKEKK